MKLPSGLQHPCRETCSGWKQGYDEAMSAISTLTLEEVEKNHIQLVMLKNNNNLTEAAKSLGICRATMYRKLKEYETN